MHESGAVLREPRWPDDPPLRVCLLIGEPELGAADRQLVLLAKGLRRRGVEVTVAVLGAADAADTGLRAAGVDVVGVGFRPDRPLWSNLAAMGRLARHLRRTHADVVHALSFDAHVLGPPLARLVGVPVVVVGRPGLAGDTRHRRWTRFAVGMADLVIADARAMADGARASGVPADRLTVIYNAVPDSAFADAARARAGAECGVVLCAADFRPGGGHHDLIRAAILLRERGRPCLVRLAGDGPERPALERLVAELDLDSALPDLIGTRTHLLGSPADLLGADLPGADLLGADLLGAGADLLGTGADLLTAPPDIDDLLAGADVVVFPSTSDGPGGPVARALAARRPVVATAVGAASELLADGRGILVPPGDPVRLADAIQAVLSDPAAADRLARRAQAWTREFLGTDAMVDQHLDAYTDLVARA
jgi:glycosyltransferase involved in cell wall biosynthesis